MKMHLANRFDWIHRITLVTGVMKDLPKLSHLRFGSLASFSTVELMNPEADGGFMDWTSVYMNYVYVLVPENGSVGKSKNEFG